VNRTVKSYDAFFIPPSVDPDRAVALGINWLVEQPGDPLILLHAKKMVDNNRLLGRAVRKYRITYESPRTIWRGGWSGGPILAPWASTEVLQCIDDQLFGRATAVCVIGWRDPDPNHEAWVASRNAVDLETRRPLGRQPEEMVNPVVRIAFAHAERFVNHNNLLVQTEDKAYVVRTMQELVRAGYGLDLDAIAMLAVATGWSSEETKRIREYGRQILDGHSFRLQSSVGPKPGDCKYWEEEAANESRQRASGRDGTT